VQCLQGVELGRVEEVRKRLFKYDGYVGEVQIIPRDIRDGSWIVHYSRRSVHLVLKYAYSRLSFAISDPFRVSSFRKSFRMEFGI